MMADYDLYNIEDRLKEIDSRILRIDFNYERERHEIIAWDDTNKVEYIAFTVPWGQLDGRVEEELRRIRPERYNAFEEWRQMEERRERAEEKKIEDLARDFAETFREPLIRDAFY